MGKLFYLAVFILICIISCKTKNLGQNQYANFPDTLILETQKVKGSGLLPKVLGMLQFYDPSKNLFGLRFIIPDKFNDTEIATIMMDQKPLPYKKFLSRDYDTAVFYDFIDKFHVDTTKIAKQEIPRNFLSILKATLNGTKVFIVDQNNNQDFSDDSIRPLKKINCFTITPIEFNYDVYNDSIIEPTHSWINLGLYSDNESDIIGFVSEHTIASFTIKNKNFTLAVFDNQGYSVYLDPRITLTVDNGKAKDTILSNDIIKYGEYLKIDNHYYQFNYISNDAHIITLIDEPDFNSKIGTQVGMIAPDFTCLSIDNDSISLKDYKGNYLLLINVSSCWSPQSSYEVYKDLTEKCKSTIECIGIDDSPITLRQNISKLNLSGKFTIAAENMMIRKNYRPDFCSRTCFLINPKGRIINKFEIFDWESNLSEFLNK